jgi:hypothetical protein
LAVEQVGAGRWRALIPITERGDAIEEIRRHDRETVATLTA